MDSWRTIASAPEGVRVKTRIADAKGIRNEQYLTRRGRLWFTDDGTYVYYEPTHWRY
jgi:hypothetical protein